ncbi:MAG: cyclic nucleotide-binding domain-containing protein [Verrucomicrobia bacterium]|nr:cyclic nucleotide-binding domain-containing protein [Verrucomicrobiota bacterium]MBI3867221.1 cyclic nucleotide-binding domain-containing protein [Verrucomicrobiota bacterium]
MKNIAPPSTPTEKAHDGADAPSIETAVAQHPFLAGMSPAHRELIARSASLVDLRAGDLVFKQGDPAHKFYLILWGAVSLTHAGLKGNVPIQCVGAGEVLGWSWLFPPNAWHFNAMVTEPTRAIEIDGKALSALCAQQHEFGYELMRRISQVVIERLQKTRQKLFKLSGQL